MDGTASQSPPVVAFGISGAEPFGFGHQRISEMELGEISCEDGRWIKLDKEHIQWRALALVMLNIWFYYETKLIN